MSAHKVIGQVVGLVAAGVVFSGGWALTAAPPENNDDTPVASQFPFEILPEPIAPQVWCCPAECSENEEWIWLEQRIQACD